MCSQEAQIDVALEQEAKNYRLVLTPPKVLEAVINVELDLENMTASQPDHFVYRVDGLQHSFRNPVEIVHFSAANPSSVYHFHWKYKWLWGLPGGIHNDRYVYALPYRQGDHHVVAQGYFGSFSHNKGSPSEYSIDFSMPEGTAVCAAREGIVVVSYGDSTVGGNDKKYGPCGNFIAIKHSDGTYARYVHLQPHGNLARLGQTVRKGDQIGLSGSTGFADRPHLHFEVSVTLDGEHEKSLPVTFHTAQGDISDLKQGESY